MSETGTLGEVVNRFLEGKGWSSVTMRDGSSVLRYDGEHASWRCRIFVDEARAQVVVYSLFPELVPSGRHAAVLALLNRVNLGLVLGNFELSTDRGELRMRTSIDVEGDRLTPALLTHLVHANLAAMDRYLPALAAVALDGAEPSAVPLPGAGA